MQAAHGIQFKPNSALEHWCRLSGAHSAQGLAKRMVQSDATQLQISNWRYFTPRWLREGRLQRNALRFSLTYDCAKSATALPTKGIN